MERLQYIYTSLTTFSTAIISVLSYVWSIFQSLWYGMTTLLSGIMDLVDDIFNSGLF